MLVGSEVAGIAALVFELIQFVLVNSGMQISLSIDEIDEKLETTLLHVLGKGKNEMLSFILKRLFILNMMENILMHFILINAFYFNEKDGS